MTVSDEGAVVLFTKPALPGRVKTRLIGTLTAEQAAALHAAFVGDLVDRLSRGDFALRIAWAIEDGEAIPDDLVPGRIEGFRQRGDDLGARLDHALRRLAGEFLRVAAVGSDHPTLSASRVEEALARLDEADVVLGPASDGGYYLIALRRPLPGSRLFEEIPWSGPRVLETTLSRCRELGLEVALLAEESDVDDAGDLERLIGRLRATPEAAPRTARLLTEWGRLET